MTKQIIVLVLLAATAACQKNIFQPATVAPATMRDVPALRLSFRYEADVPAPALPANAAPPEEKNPAVLADFDASRQQENLVQTISSPNKQRILAVYQRLGDPDASYRLDMYAGDGKFLRRVTPETMTADFPDIIVWSPDSTSVAFVAIARQGGLNSVLPLPNANANTNANTNANKPPAANSNANANSEPAAPPVTPPPPSDGAPNVLTFRTEQIYVCNSEGLDLKPVTQNEGLIYYYFVWSPDGSMLAALAASYQEWRYLQMQADKNNEIFVPLGRPRIVEKNGRERRLDDNLTGVHPVWSPDSAKVAVGFDKQIRIYDAIGDQPTQAAIPLRNQLLLSSQAYDQKVNNEQSPAANANAEPNANQPSMTLPDEKTLVSFQPIVMLEWSADTLLYFQTGYVKQYKTGDGARSSLRWHRLILSPQATVVGNK
ncbi:MAG: PD40 domain-containing protein [Acidobacteria bacterium]|nr:PD40 domain-containing protein [Acidobacteriota bacterium]